MWLCQYRGDTPHILLDEYKTYGHQGSGDIYCKIAGPDLERSHTAAENTLFTDGVPHIKPLIIFKEKRFRFSNAKKAWGSKMRVLFQQNNWYDDEIMVK